VKYSLDSAVAICRGYVGWFYVNNNGIIIIIMWK
jgi:hypothetical protein